MGKISAQDIKRTSQLVLLAPVAWLLPEKSWPAACDLLARLSGAISRRKRRAFEKAMPAFIARLLGESDKDARVRVVSAGHQEVVATLRAHRPGGWRPKVNIVGAERLDAALAANRGVILWVSAFEFSGIVTKMALSQAGYELHHLSRPQHGFSDTEFGRRFLNPIQTSVERRYLAERIVMTADGAAASLRALHERLARNKIVSITVTPNAGQLLSLPLFDETIQLPLGPVTLARTTNAALLPVFTIRGPSGGFYVYIETPLTTTGARGDLTPLREYVQLLESYLQRNPACWRGWLTGRDLS